jgi:glycosyltransferase involved in cell wall biosynthesis
MPIGLSVVVPSVNGTWALFPTLDALSVQDAGVAIEILVVDRLADQVREEVRKRYPSVRVIKVAAGTTIPQMRHLAIEAATGDSIAVIEDHVLVPPDWATRLLAAQRAGHPVVGGSVENAATSRLVDWAAFLCEYSHCIPPIQGGSVSWLTGNNVVYPRTLLERFKNVTASGAWENELHGAILGAGIPLHCEPAIVVGHKMHYSVWDYLSQRYLYARSYAGARVASRGMGSRMAYGAASLVLPPLLFWRTVQRVLPKRGYRMHLLKSLPLLGLFVLAWAAGEAVGYVAGPGSALAKVK